jgi:hypothetical protein
MFRVNFINFIPMDFNRGMKQDMKTFEFAVKGDRV